MVSNTILITQARSGSTRLPGKVLKEIGGKSLLQIHLERLKKCKTISEIIVATTIKDEDQVIYNKVIEWGFSASKGSETDVLDRFYQSVKDKKADWIVRVTSDCPLIDPELVLSLIHI
jgi:spore coat polysaccharide biosynthesis protein SpsF